jgi:hypothetical protein
LTNLLQIKKTHSRIFDGGDAETGMRGKTPFSDVKDVKKNQIQLPQQGGRYENRIWREKSLFF